MKKRICVYLTIMLVLSLCVPLLGNEEAVNYFPSTLDSYWVYEDQDGKELKRTVIEGEEIAGEIYQAFNYEPELKDWTNYIKYIRPELFKIDDKRITLSVKEGIEKAVKARLTNEVDFLFKAIAQDGFPADEAPTFDITAEAEDNMALLLKPISSNEEWDVIKTKVNIKGMQNGEVQGTVDYTIIETGIVLGTETVETAAGTFENCLKVQYQTETTVILTPEESEMNPPGETVTTVWFAPNVGIVKIHEKSGNLFLDMLPKDEGLPFIIPSAKETTLELKKFEIKEGENTDFSITLNSDENTPKKDENTIEEDQKTQDYLSSTLGSYWIYEDQEGNEIKRTVIEGEEISGEVYHAFEYEPEMKDWKDYSRFIRPELFKISKKGITLIVKEDLEKSVKARLTKEMEMFTEIIKEDDPSEAEKFTYTIKVDVDQELNLLPKPIVLNEEWDAINFKVSVSLAFSQDDSVTIDFTINESGIVKGKETVETAAGTFEDCLKVQYRTETLAIFDQEVEPDGVDHPGETVTTVWFAPNIGIVKYHQQTNYTFLELIPEDEGLPIPTTPLPKTLQLKKYEIKKAETINNGND